MTGHAGYSQVLFTAASNLTQTAVCDCFGEISVRQQGDLQVCLHLGRMQSDYARIPMSPSSPYICTREPAGAGETGTQQCGFGWQKTKKKAFCVIEC